MRKRPAGQRETYSTDWFIIAINAEKTEKYYLEGLKESLSDDRKKKVTLQYLKDNPQKFVERLIEPQISANISPQFNAHKNVHKWIVFDHDQVQSFDKIIQDAENKEISVAWSNPCIEVWFWAYFEKVPSFVGDSQAYINNFKDVFSNKTGIKYEKNDKNIYGHLWKYGDEDKAFKWALKNRDRFPKELPYSQRNPSTTLDILVKKIRGDDK